MSTITTQPTAATSSTDKLCIHCKHHVADQQGPMCSHPEHVFRSVITGQILLSECRDARGRAPYARTHEVIEGRCGLAGQFFELRNSAPISTASATTDASENDSGSKA